MKGKVMSYIRRKGAVFVLLLVFSIVFCGIHPVSAESRTQDVYKPYDASVQSGSAAYGFTDGDKWGAVYEKITEKPERRRYRYGILPTVFIITWLKRVKSINPASDMSTRLRLTERLCTKVKTVRWTQL